MIWLTWRQFRVQAAIVYGALAMVAVVLVITGGQLADLSQDAGSSFLDLLAADGTKRAVFNLGFAAVLALPAIVGIFWGAPLIARELETGTHRLAWNQTVTRTGWLTTKVALIGLVAMAGAGLLSLLLTWWCGPVDDALAAGGRNGGLLGVSRMSPPAFGTRGIVPIGYTAFAFALGVTAGAVIRRTVPAMALTLVIFVAVQIAAPPLLRQHLGPTQITTTITQENLNGLLAEGPNGPVKEMRVSIDSPGAWVFANQTVDASGRAVSELPSWVLGCVPEQAPKRMRESDPGCFTRLAEAGYRQRVAFQPASRFWTLQAIETAIFTALALALMGFCFWWVRHRLS